MTEHTAFIYVSIYSTEECVGVFPPYPPGQPFALSNGAAGVHSIQWAGGPLYPTDAYCVPHSFSLFDEPNGKREGIQQVIRRKDIECNH